MEICVPCHADSALVDRALDYLRISGRGHAQRRNVHGVMPLIPQEVGCRSRSTLIQKKFHAMAEKGSK